MWDYITPRDLNLLSFNEVCREIGVISVEGSIYNMFNSYWNIQDNLQVKFSLLHDPKSWLKDRKIIRSVRDITKRDINLTHAHALK